MAVIQTDMFWEVHLQNSGVKPFRDTLDQLDMTDTAHQIKWLCNGGGRQLHATQSQPAQPTQHGAENHQFENADAGRGESCH